MGELGSALEAMIFFLSLLSLLSLADGVSWMVPRYWDSPDSCNSCTTCPTLPCWMSKEATGTFASENFGNESRNCGNYPNNLIQIFAVEVTGAEYLDITFTEFATQASDWVSAGCTNDFVEIYYSKAINPNCGYECRKNDMAVLRGGAEHRPHQPHSQQRLRLPEADTEVY